MALKTPRQARSRRTLARMERASIELITAGGLEAANVQDIARRANSSVGSFYSRFDGKDDLIAHLHHRLWEDVGVRWDEAIPEDAGSLQETLRQVVLGLFHAFESDARARRLVGAMREATVDDRPSFPILARIRAEAASRIRAHDAELARPDSGMPTDVLLRAWVAAIQSFADEDAAVPSDRPARETLAGELVAMAESYLSGRQAEDPLPEAPGGMEFFDVWG